jgi:hypothetical protein
MGMLSRMRSLLSGTEALPPDGDDWEDANGWGPADRAALDADPEWQELLDWASIPCAPAPDPAEVQLPPAANAAPDDHEGEWADIIARAKAAPAGEDAPAAPVPVVAPRPPEPAYPEVDLWAAALARSKARALEAPDPRTAAAPPIPPLSQEEEEWAALITRAKRPILPPAQRPAPRFLPRVKPAPPVPLVPKGDPAAAQARFTISLLKNGLARSEPRPTFEDWNAALRGTKSSSRS